MHTCLNVDEIIRLVASELVASKAKATAVALACCHKNFEEPVLDTLWETQERILPLLRSLPRDVWVTGKHVCVPTIFVLSSFNSFIPKYLKRPPTVSEWARFRKYARRMRQLRERVTLNFPPPFVSSNQRLYAIDEPLFQNLRTLELQSITGEDIPVIPSFLSPRITTISITFQVGSSLSAAIVAPMITAFLTLCPNLQDLSLCALPRDPTITDAVSAMLLAINHDTLQSFQVDSPLTEVARESIYKNPGLRGLSVVVERDILLPTMVLPNLTDLIIQRDYDSDWSRMFHGATLEKLKTVTLFFESYQAGGLLETFERVALATSIQNTLSKFQLYTSSLWNPNYHSLLPFTQLTHLIIVFFCDLHCSSTVDDDVIISLARAMPKLETLQLGHDPCGETPTGATVKGLVALAHHCQDLSTLRVHFQVDSFAIPPAVARDTSDTGPTDPPGDCALRILEVGSIPMPEEWVSFVALTLAYIFPRLETIHYIDEEWGNVMGAISLSRQIINHSSKEPPPPPRSNSNDTSPGTALNIGS